MTNRFLATSHGLALRTGQGTSPVARGTGRSTARAHALVRPMAATDRTLVLLVENGGIDLGIPGLVDRLISALPGGDLIPDSARRDLVTAIRDALLSVTDTLIESAELALNRFGAAKPSLYGDVRLLRDGTASYDALKATLLELSRAGKIIDLFILTHGSGDHISVAGGIDGAKIRAVRAELGRPLTLRSVYMMNCVASSLNQAWIDAGARTVSGARGNNYLPEPSMHFFWTGWQGGQTFETAVTSAYRRTIALMNGVVRGVVAALPIPGASLLASRIDLESLDVVQSSAPVIQGQRTLTITSDDLTFTQSVRSGPATTVLPMSVLDAGGFRTPAPRTPARDRASRSARAFSDAALQAAVSPAALALVERWELSPGDGPERRSEIRGRAEEAAGTVAARVTVPLAEHQVDALVSFVCGITPARFERSTVLTLLNAGRPADVPAEMRRWVKARVEGAVVEIDALVRRRAAEAELFTRPPHVAAAPGDGSGPAVAPVVQQSFRYESPSRIVRPVSGPPLSKPMNPLLIAGLPIVDAASIGLGAVSVAQAQASASAGSFTLTYAQAQRMLTTEARQNMPGAHVPKTTYSAQLLHLGIATWGSAEANIIIEWEGNPYGEIGTPVIRRELSSSTAWTHALANVQVVVVSRIPLPGTDPRAWPIVYSYEGTYDPVGNGHFEFTGEFEIDAFGGLRFTRHEVVSRAFFEPGIVGEPEQYVAKGRDVVVSPPPIPAEQAEYVRTRLP